MWFSNENNMTFSGNIMTFSGGEYYDVLRKILHIYVIVLIGFCFYVIGGVDDIKMRA